eukprot:scaffold36281_cov52-Phaeocystis_antarctica.AAC.3
MGIAVNHLDGPLRRRSAPCCPGISGHLFFWDDHPATRKRPKVWRVEVCSRAFGRPARAPTPSSLPRATRAHLTCSPCAQAS